MAKAEIHDGSYLALTAVYYFLGFSFFSYDSRYGNIFSWIFCANLFYFVSIKWKIYYLFMWWLDLEKNEIIIGETEIK